MTTLKTVVFMGSAKNVIPFWGGDKRLGDRVLKWVVESLKTRSESLGSAGAITHDVSVFDPLEIFAKDGPLGKMSGGELLAPTFYVKDLPDDVAALKQKLVEADCFVVVSPEYNHSVPPALASLMGHFGGSCYACKPSAICTYSNGPWGGMRSAVAISVLCHELGCLPVSKFCGVPGAADILNEDGTPKDPAHRMLKQLPAMLNQLEWMAVAMKRQREDAGTF